MSGRARKDLVEAGDKRSGLRGHNGSGRCIDEQSGWRGWDER